MGSIILCRTVAIAIHTCMLYTIVTVGCSASTPFKYFEMFLETVKVKGFPLVLHCMTPYYATNPGIRTQPEPRNTLPISGSGRDDAPVSRSF